MTTNPTPIPRNLKPGDIIVDNHGQRHVFEYYNDDGDANTSTCAIFFPTGYRLFVDRVHAVRIIRTHLVAFTSRAKARAAAKAFGGKVRS